MLYQFWQLLPIGSGPHCYLTFPGTAWLGVIDPGPRFCFGRCHGFGPPGRIHKQVQAPAWDARHSVLDVPVTLPGGFKAISAATLAIVGP